MNHSTGQVSYKIFFFQFGCREKKQTHTFGVSVDQISCIQNPGFSYHGIYGANSFLFVLKMVKKDTYVRVFLLVV